MKCTLEMTRQQADVVCKALDLFSRVLIGQLEEIESVCTFNGIPGDMDALQQALNEAKHALGHPSNGSWGIYNENVPDRARIAWDIQKVIRHAIAYHEHPEGGMGVNFQVPDQSGKEPLAKISITEEK